MNKAVFLDRDGVVNDNKKPVNKPKDLHLYPWTGQAIKMLNMAGFLVFIVTNQGGIELGYFKEEDLKDIHKKMLRDLNKVGAKIQAIEYCPHFKEKCQCRKPSGGMIKKLAKEYNIDLNNSYMIGDRYVDILSGLDAGCKTIKIGKPCKGATYTVDNLLSAVKIILKA